MPYTLEGIPIPCRVSKTRATAQAGEFTYMHQLSVDNLCKTR